MSQQIILFCAVGFVYSMAGFWTGGHQCRFSRLSLDSESKGSSVIG